MSSSSSSQSDSSHAYSLTFDELDPYALLNLPVTATETDIKSAFRALSSILHPDKLPLSLTQSSSSSSIPPSQLSLPFIHLTRAVSILTNKYQRWAWNEYGRHGVEAYYYVREKFDLERRSEESIKQTIKHAVKLVKQIEKAGLTGQRSRVGSREDEQEEEGEDEEEVRFIHTSLSADPLRHLTAGRGNRSLSVSHGGTRLLARISAFPLFSYPATSHAQRKNKLFALLSNNSSISPSSFSPGTTSSSTPFPPSSFSLPPFRPLAVSLRHILDLRIGLTDTIEFAFEVDRKDDSPGTASKPDHVSAQLNVTWKHRQESRLFTTTASTVTKTVNTSVSYPTLDTHTRAEVGGQLHLPTFLSSPLRSLSHPSFSLTRQTSSLSSSSLGASIGDRGTLELESSFVTILDSKGAGVWESDSSIHISSDRMSLEEKISRVIGRRRCLRAFMRVGVTIPHTVPLPPFHPPPMINPTSPFELAQTPSGGVLKLSLIPNTAATLNERLNWAGMRTNLSISLGLHYAMSPAHALTAYLHHTVSSGIMLVCSYQLHAFNLTLPIQLTPEWNSTAAAIGLTLPTLSLLWGRWVWLLYEKKQKRESIRRELNREGQRIWQERQQTLRYIQSLSSLARQKRREEESRLYGIIILSATLLFDHSQSSASTQRHITDPLLRRSIDATDLVQVQVAPVVAEPGQIQVQPERSELRATSLSSLLPPHLSHVTRNTEDVALRMVYRIGREGGKKRVEWRGEERIVISNTAVEAEHASARAHDDIDTTDEEDTSDSDGSGGRRNERRSSWSADEDDKEEDYFW